VGGRGRGVEEGDESGRKRGEEMGKRGEKGEEKE
jgi:hypothetical protein